PEGIRVEYGERDPVPGRRRRQEVPERPRGGAPHRGPGRAGPSEGEDLPDRAHGDRLDRGPRRGVRGDRGDPGEARAHVRPGRKRRRARPIRVTVHRQTTSTSSVRNRWSTTVSSTDIFTPARCIRR